MSHNGNRATIANRRRPTVSEQSETDAGHCNEYAIRALTFNEIPEMQASGSCAGSTRKLLRLPYQCRPHEWMIFIPQSPLSQRIFTTLCAKWHLQPTIHAVFGYLHALCSLGRFLGRNS